MATKTRDISPIVKSKRSPNTSKTKPLVHTNAINLIASNRKNIYLKCKPSPSSSPSTYPNIIYHKRILNHRTSINKPQSSLDNTQVKKNTISSYDRNIVHNKPNVARGSLFDNRPSPLSSFDNIARGKKLTSSSCVPPSIQNKQTLTRRRLSFDNRPLLSSSLDHNTEDKKVASSITDSNIHNKQNLARTRRLSFDHRPPSPSFRDNSPQNKKLIPKSDHNIHSKQTLTRRRLSIDHKPPLSSPLFKNRTTPNPKPSLSYSSKNYTTQKSLLHKLPKTPHTSNKDVIVKKQSHGLYARTVNHDSPASLTAKECITTYNLNDIVENIDPYKGGELEQDEHQELVIEDHGELSDNVNIDEYLKAVESSSLYVVENQEVIKMEVQEGEQLVEETCNIENGKELEEIKNLEPSNLDQIVIEKQENENQEEKEKGGESEMLLRELDDCKQKKEEGKELNLKIDQEEKEESEERNNKEKEEINNTNTKNSITTMTFAKAYPQLVHKKESVVSNDVIKETASKLREERKNRVKALASAFETVISLQDPK